MGWRDLGSLVGPKGDRGEQGQRGSSVLAVGAAAPADPMDGDAWLEQSGRTGRLASVNVWKDAGLYPGPSTFPGPATHPQAAGWNKLTTEKE